jgi:hypothetical protein
VKRATPLLWSSVIIARNHSMPQLQVFLPFPLSGKFSDGLFFAAEKKDWVEKLWRAWEEVAQTKVFEVDLLELMTRQQVCVENSSLQNCCCLPTHALIRP